MSDGTTSRCARCGRPVEKTPLPAGRVAVPADEFDRMVADIHRGMTALQERVRDLELTVAVEAAIAEAVLDE